MGEKERKNMRKREREVKGEYVRERRRVNKRNGEREKT